VPGVRTETEPSEDRPMSAVATTSVSEIHPLLAGRASTRAFDHTEQLEGGRLARLLEAARWAPSASNSQPWRFLPAERGSTAHAALLQVLADGNRLWAADAAALVLVAARTTDDAGNGLPWAVYDTGQAVAHLVTQAEAEGLATHQMGGFDADAARAALGLGDELTPLVVLAVGSRTAPHRLPGFLIEREHAPRQRLDLHQLLIPAPAAG
jgi:nitroreductase